MTSPKRRTFAAFCLVLKVHIDAFARAPRRYMTATKWWLLRKRVRARAQFAPLLALSPSAHSLWVLRQEQRPSASPNAMPPIVAIVKASGAPDLLAITMASLAAEGISAHAINSDPTQELAEIAEAIDWGARPWLLPMSAGDVVVPGTAFAYRQAMERSDHALIYADDDLIDPRGRRAQPHFKPDWNPELYLHFDYLTGACILRAGKNDLVDAAAEGTKWDAKLVSSHFAAGNGASHLRQVLHSRRTRPSPRLPLPALPIAGTLPSVSVIIPTRNRVDLLSTCIAGLDRSDYPAIEAIIVDNDSDDPATLDFLAQLSARSRAGMQYRILRHPGPFNYSAINNRAVAEATGVLLCLLNNDIEMLAADWLGMMATQTLRDEVGAVGAQLLYPDGRVQHAGVVIGVGNAAGHAHRFMGPADEGYFQRHALPQFTSAVTGACLVVRRDRFLAVGGLDEAAFPVAFNDVDLCLRLNSRGWQSFYEPRAVLIHHESVSRGFDRDPAGAARFARELAALQERWRTDQICDPYHHPCLSRASEQFAVAL